MSDCRLSLLLASGSFVEKMSGPYQSLRDTAFHLGERGHRLTLVGTRKNADQLDPDDWGGADVRLFRSVGPRSWHIAPGLRGWLRTDAPSVDAVGIHGVWLMSNLEVARWARARGVPYMITVHGNFNEEALRYSARKKRWARRWLLDDIFENASCFQALNEDEYRAIRAYGIKRPVCVVPNGAVMPREKDFVPGSEDSRTVLYLGRLHPIKNLEGLLRAWKTLCSDFADWRLVVAGDGEARYVRSLKSLAATLGLQGSADFVGYVDGAAKSELLRRSSVFVLPSFSEGLPVAALEAMAARTAVILTPSCHLQEVEASGAGLVTGHDPEQIARDLRRLLSMSLAELAAAGGRARDLVFKNYSWSAVCDQLEDVFSWMVRGGRLPECVRRD